MERVVKWCLGVGFGDTDRRSDMEDALTTHYGIIEATHLQ